jgi:hypothetical protein
MRSENDRDEDSSRETSSAHLDQGRFKTGAGEAHVGWFVANVAGSMKAPSQYCLDDGSLYAGAPYRLGRVNVFADGTAPGEVVGGPVIVYGRRLSGLDKKIRRVGPCPTEEERAIPQLRSDWVADEADWRGHTTRARLAKTDYIEAVAVYRLPLVEAERDGDSVRLTLTNPFDRPLGASTIFSLHYEGGPKKPMPIMEPRPLGDLAPGASMTFVAAAPPSSSPQKPGGGRKLFRGYRLAGSLGDVHLDLLAPVPTAAE